MNFCERPEYNLYIIENITKVYLCVPSASFFNDLANHEGLIRPIGVKMFMAKVTVLLCLQAKRCIII